MLTFCPSLRLTVHGTFIDPQPVCLAITLDKDPLVPDTFSVEVEVHVSDVSTKINEKALSVN